MRVCFFKKNDYLLIKAYTMQTSLVQFIDQLQVIVLLWDVTWLLDKQEAPYCYIIKH